jgi:hypothetical protein
MIEEVIHSSEFKDNNNILEKEYNKFYNRLSKKFDGSTLDYQVRIKLIQKGFSASEIDNFLQNKKNF